MSIFQALMLAVGVIDSPELTFDCVVIRWKDHSVPTTTTQTSTLFHVYPVPAFWTACIHNRSARLLTFVASVTTTSNLRYAAANKQQAPPNTVHFVLPLASSVN
eukprot:m.87270 g.87270  ORF g.87270 m.87270 type:complete len:104 (-) comp12825_c0_seq19:1794-2105(-)